MKEQLESPEDMPYYFAEKKIIKINEHYSFEIKTGLPLTEFIFFSHSLCNKVMKLLKWKYKTIMITFMFTYNLSIVDII